MSTPACIAALILLPVLLPAQIPDLDNLYQENRWFDFRDAMASRTAPAFYQGQLALAFHDWPRAEKELTAVLKSNADSARSFEAGLGLLQMASLSGRRQQGRAVLARLEQITNGGPAATQARQLLRQYRAEFDFPDQAVVSRGSSRLFYQEVSNRLMVPLLIQGVESNYMLDSGAQQCVISQAEARRLDLLVHPSSVALDTFDAQSHQATGIAIAPDLVMGNFHFRNVMFLVTPGDDLGGIVGLPVLLALQTLRWSSDGVMELGFPAQPLNLHDANLAVAGQLLTRATVGNRALILSLDLGAFDTLLFPRFAQDFAESVRNPLSVGPRNVGNDLTDPQTTTLAGLTLRIGGLTSRLAPALVASRPWVLSDTAIHGNLGMDLLGQARSVTLDLGAMKLTLDGVDRTAGPRDLPPDFFCATGFTCVVKCDDDGACFVDRLPGTPWPGNPVDSDRDYPERCVLTSSASCQSGTWCRVVFDSNQSCHLEHVTAAPAITAAAAATPSHPSPSLPPPTGPNVSDILQRFMKYDSLDLTPARDYIYQQDQETKTLNKDGRVKQTTTETREFMNLYDATYSRLIRKNGEELSPAKAKAEQARFDKAVAARAHETPEAKAKRQEAERKQAAQQLTCESEILTVFEARLTGAEEVNGRASWVVELNPRPDAAPHCSDLKIFSKFRLKLWIDQQEYRGAKIEANNIAPVTWGAVLIRIPTGGLHVESAEQRHEDGAWLQFVEYDKIDVKALLLVPVRADIRTTYTNYRKFQTDSRILPIGGNQ